MDTPERILERLLATGHVRRDQFRPCSDEDIARLEQHHGVVLPEAYRLFLRTMVRGVGDFLVDDHWYAFYDSLFDLGTACAAEYAPDLNAPLPPGAFVFATRTGDCYLCFGADGTCDDPPAFGWSDNMVLHRLYESFWGWLDDLVRDYERLYADERSNARPD